MLNAWYIYRYENTALTGGIRVIPYFSARAAPVLACADPKLTLYMRVKALNVADGLLDRAHARSKTLKLIIFILLCISACERIHRSDDAVV